MRGRIYDGRQNSNDDVLPSAPVSLLVWLLLTFVVGCRTVLSLEQSLRCVTDKLVFAAYNEEKPRVFASVAPHRGANSIGATHRISLLWEKPPPSFFEKIRWL